MKLVIGNKNYSSWSLRAWFVLRKLGLDFEEIRVPLDVPGFKEQLLKHSSSGKVPVLIDADLTIWDSMAIFEYLAEQYPQLWPTDAKTRAHARSVANEMHSSFFALRGAMPMNCRAENRSVQISDATQRDINRIFEIWSDCRSRYGQSGPWLLGELSIADAMYLPVASRFLTYGVVPPPEAKSYQDFLLKDPLYCEWLDASRSEEETIENSELGLRT